MSDEASKGVDASGPAAITQSGAEDAGSMKALNRRAYLKAAAVGVGVGALGFPAVAKAQNKTWKLKLQSNWTGIGIESQDRAAKLFVERVNTLSGGRIEVTNFNAEGALSDERGKVRIDWSCDDGKCLLRWSEIGGPTVVTPTRLGFGSRMMKASLSQIAGTIEPRFEPDGYSCVLTFSANSSKHFGKAGIEKLQANTEPGLRAPLA